MALSGQLNDLSLPELIELFCNQNKSGRLKIFYARGPGLFYFQNGALVDAKIGVLSGVEAVYYAITLENALFKFNPNRQATRRTIHQPWTHVALEGLRRIDEKEPQKEAFPDDDPSYLEDPEYNDEDAPEVEEMMETAKAAAAAKTTTPLPFKMTAESAAAPKRNKLLVFAGIGVAAVLGVAALGIPAGWYSSPPPPPTKPQPAAVEPAPAPAPAPAPDTVTPNPQAQPDATALKHDNERDRKRAEEERRKADREKPSPAIAQTDSKPEPPKPAAPKTVTVQVTYDESGRVTGASGGDAAALRIARQKRFPPGKAGSATVTIPVN